MLFNFIVPLTKFHMLYLPVCHILYLYLTNCRLEAIRIENRAGLKNIGLNLMAKGRYS